jgi:hypothetical protein
MMINQRLLKRSETIEKNKMTIKLSIGEDAEHDQGILNRYKTYNRPDLTGH